MEQLKALSVQAIRKDLKKSDCSFNPETLGRIIAALTPVIGAAELDGLNETVASLKRRKMTVEDISRIAYVHTRSVDENDGYSPRDRVLAYCKKAGHEYDGIHFRVATQVLLAVGYLVLREEEDRKVHRCRRYSLPSELLSDLGLPTPK